MYHVHNLIKNLKEKYFFQEDKKIAFLHAIRWKNQRYIEKLHQDKFNIFYYRNNTHPLIESCKYYHPPIFNHLIEIFKKDNRAGSTFKDEQIIKTLDFLLKSPNLSNPSIMDRLLETLSQPLSIKKSYEFLNFALKHEHISFLRVVLKHVIKDDFVQSRYFTKCFTKSLMAPEINNQSIYLAESLNTLAQIEKTKEIVRFLKMTSQIEEAQDILYLLNQKSDDYQLKNLSSQKFKKNTSHGYS